MGHSDFVDVGKAHGEADIRFLWILYTHVDLAANVAGRLLYR